MKRLFTFLVIIIISRQLGVSQMNTPPLPNGDTKIGGHFYAGAGNELWTDATALYFNYRGSASSTYFWNLGGSNGNSLLSIINNGNIGIGILSPAYRFTVKGTSSVPQTLISCDGSNGIFFHAQGTYSHTNWLIGQQRTSDGGLEFTPSTSPGNTIFSAPAMILKAGGTIGIGTLNPSGKLSVSDGQIHINTLGNGSTTIDDLSTAIILGPKTQRNRTIGAYYAGLAFNHLLNYSGATYNSSNHGWIGLRLVSTPGSEQSDLIFATKEGTDIPSIPIERMCVKYNGNVLIGKATQSNSNYKLDINGTIRADGVVVNTTGADFVFDSGYKLPTLAEVELFIKENNHLPDLASAAEMKENGMNVSEMQTKLLQKIEELTLYIIELNKKIEKLEADKTGKF